MTVSPVQPVGEFVQQGAGAEETQVEVVYPVRSRDPARKIELVREIGRHEGGSLVSQPPLVSAATR